MARQRESHIRRQITSLISPQLIRRRGRDLGVVQRHRKVDIVAFVYTSYGAFIRSNAIYREQACYLLPSVSSRS